MVDTMKEIVARLEATDRQIDDFSDVRERLRDPNPPPMTPEMRRRMMVYMDRYDVWESGGGIRATLTSPTAAATGTTTANLGVTTDQPSGTLYAVVTTSATKPTPDQIKAGQDHTGAAATWSGNQAVTSTGVKSFSATGLTASTTYWAHFVHETAGTSNIESATFTTPAV